MFGRMKWAIIALAVAVLAIFAVVPVSAELQSKYDYQGLLFFDGSNNILRIYDSNTGVAITQPMVFGADGAGVSVTFYSDTAGDHMVWSDTSKRLTITGTDATTALNVADGNVVIADDFAVHTDDFVVDADGNITMAPTGGTVQVTGILNAVGALTVGSDGAGHTVTFYSDTAGDHFVWSDTAAKLTITGTAGQDALLVADGNLQVTDDLIINTDKFRITGSSGDIARKNSEDDATGVTTTATKLRTTGGTLTDNDVIYQVSAVGYNDNATPAAKTVANIKLTMADASDTTEDGQVIIETMRDGTAASAALTVGQTVASALPVTVAGNLTVNTDDFVVDTAANISLAPTTGIVAITGDIQIGSKYQPVITYATLACAAATVNGDGGTGVSAGYVEVPYNAVILRAYANVTTGTGDAGDTADIIINDANDATTIVTTLVSAGDVSAAQLVAYNPATGAALLGVTSATNKYVLVIIKDVGDDAGASTALAGTLIVEYLRQ